MKTVSELGRFLIDNHLSMRVGLTRSGFHVDFLSQMDVVATGFAYSFPDAVDKALTVYAVRRVKKGVVA